MTYAIEYTYIGHDVYQRPWNEVTKLEKERYETREAAQPIVDAKNNKPFCPFFFRVVEISQ